MHHVISLLVLLKLLLGCAPTHSACDRKSLWTQSRALPRGFSVCHAVTLQRRVMLPGCTFVKSTTTTTRTHDQSVLTDKLPSFWLFVVSLASTLLEEGGDKVDVKWSDTFSGLLYGLYPQVSRVKPQLARHGLNHSLHGAIGCILKIKRQDLQNLVLICLFLFFASLF